ncbi:MAG TPA: C45 family peptidase [Solirubrobacteraceae bacterium]|nr:C45 family peptidase [Solirubrobacteraceae bacterium]
MAANVAVYERLLPPGVPDLSRWPDLLAEVEGIAAGAGLPVEALLRLQARTELLGGAECSLLGRPGRVEQTWDWHPDVVPLVWIVEQPGGRWFATLTEAGMVGKIGLSSAGLCVGLNFLRCSLDGGLDGVPIHVLLRLLLDRVDAFDDALKLLTAAEVRASSCVTVGSAAEVAAVELSPGGACVLRSSRIVHTNHFLAGPPAGEDLEAAEAPSTFERLAELERTGSLRSVWCEEDPHAPWPDRRATLAAATLEPAVPRFVVAGRSGETCEVALP